METGKTKILTVCLGNICRSPLAEGLLKSKLPETHFFIDSAGTGGWHAGEQPDKRSIQIAQKYGIDISNQRARKFQISDFQKFDVIYAMDLSNKKDLMQLAPTPKDNERIELILESLFENEQVDVPDPYYGGLQEFEHVYQLLNQACEIISKKWISRLAL